MIDDPDLILLHGQRNEQKKEIQKNRRAKADPPGSWIKWNLGMEKYNREHY